MLRRIIPLIMCGGAGTRLWPASREVRPKQFLPLFGARSTFQGTLIRVSDENPFERSIVITNAAYRFTVLEQLAEIGTLAPRLRRVPPLRKSATGMPWSWPWSLRRPTTWFATTRPSSSLAAGSGCGGRRADCDLRHPAGTRRDRIGLCQSRGRGLGHSAPSQSSSRNLIPPRPPNTSRPVTSGTAATSCSAPRPCATNTASSMRRACRQSPRR